MKALNEPTVAILSKMMEKFREQLEKGEKTPYDTLVEKRAELHPECGPGEWPEEAREPAVEALGIFVAVNLGGMLSVVMNEIGDAGKDLVRGDDHAKKSAFELAQSMGFIETVFKTWFESIDVEAIAEAMFEAGEAAEKKRATTKDDPAAAKAKKVQEKASTLIDELMARYKPSNN
jgi:hypothetical protein